MQVLQRAISSFWRSSTIQHLVAPGDGKPKFPSLALRLATKATQESEELPTLKSQLRLLYKLVHPDLLHSHPNERDENERSFQVLQEYLAAAQGGPDSHGEGSAPRLYDFKFFIRRQAELDELYKVELTLPRPQKSRSSHGALPLTTRMALGQLLEACGLSAEFSGGVKGEERLGLADMFQQASEMLRQSDTAALTAERYAIVVRNALRMGRGVTVNFMPLSESVDAQVEALERLAGALDKVPDLDLRGCTIVVGNEYGVDPLGNIWLYCGDELEHWASWLPKVDMEKLRSSQQAAKWRLGKEFQVAHLLEVEMIFTDHRTAIEKEYSEFLERMSRGVEEHGAIEQGRFHDVPIRVVSHRWQRNGPEHSDEAQRADPSSQKHCHSPREPGKAVPPPISKKEPAGKLSLEGSLDGGGRGENSGGPCHLYSVDEAMGLLIVPVTASYDDVASFVKRAGPRASVQRRKYKLAEQRLVDTKAHVRAKLRLRHLTCDDRISKEQFFSACSRLLRNASELQGLMEGLSVCISDEHRLPAAGLRGTHRSLLHLKWNFSMSDL